MLNKIIAVLLLCVSLLASAESPVHIIIPAGPGGQIDIMCRDLVKAISVNLKRDSYCDFKAGAGGYLGIQSVAKIKNETLITVLDAVTLSNMMLSFTDISINDFTYIAMVGNTSLGLAVVSGRSHRLQDIRTIADGGVGGIQQYHTWTLSTKLKQDILAVPYKSRSEQINALLGGTVDAAWGTVTSLQPQAQMGKIDIIAVVGTERIPQLPNIPTFSELGLGEFGSQSPWLVFANTSADAGLVQELREMLKKNIFSDITGVVPDPANFTKSRELIQSSMQTQAKFIDYIKSLNGK